MNTNKTTREQISAFADGELADNQADMVLAALRQPEGKSAWDAYHEIGDLLRSREMAMELSPDFSARLAARLQAEPPIVAPSAAACCNIPHKQEAKDATNASSIRILRRFAVLGAAVAASVVTVFSAPQIMTALKETPSGQGSPVAPSSSSVAASAAGAISHASVVAVASTPNKASSTDGADGDVMLRDPNMDEYLLAHQRFSPSMYSTAQFARSSLFANESDK